MVSGGDTSLPGHLTTIAKETDGHVRSLSLEIVYSGETFAIFPRPFSFKTEAKDANTHKQCY